MEALTPRLTRRQIENKDISIDDLKLTLRVYSKAANTRLRALEKAGLSGSSPAYRAIKAFARDGRDFMAIDKSGRFKFNTNTRRMDRSELVDELINLHKFLFEVKTSTVSGAKEHKKKIREEHAKYKKGKSKKWSEYFSNMSEEEFDMFFDYENIMRVWAVFGSRVTIRTIEISKENPNIGDDLSLLDKALAPISAQLENMSEMALYRYVETYEPTGSVI